MKRITLFLIVSLLITILNAQSAYLPNVELKTLDGERTSSANIIDSGAITILVFWKSCSQRCCDNLDAIHETWQESLANLSVNMIGICVDAQGSWDHVKPYVNGNSWDFDTYVDVNCDLKRALGINTVPCTILLDDNGSLLCRYNGFCSGSDQFICDKIYDKTMTALAD